MTTAADLNLTAPARQRAALSTALLGTGTIFALALLLRLFGLGEAPIHFDEYYHLFAAHGWSEEGRLAILGGEYHRGALYTRFVAEVQGWLGGSLAAARASSALFGALTAAAVFLWVRLAAGPLAAWTAGLFVAFLPELVSISQMVRFYAPHGLMIIAAAAGSYGLLAGWHRLGWGARIAIAAGIGLCLLVGTYLQPTTIIAAIGIGAGLALCLLRDWGWRLPPRRDQRLLLGGLVLAGVAGLGLLYAAGALQPLWAEFRKVAMWNEAHQNAVAYYHWHMKDAFGPVWLLFPLAILCAAVRAPRLTLYCTGLFGVALVLHSLAGMKDMRYIAWALPFFLVIWALALPTVLAWAWQQARAAVAAVGLPPRGIGGLFGQAVAVGAVILLVLAVTVDASKPWRSVGEVGHRYMATDERLGNERSVQGWRQARALLAQPLAQGMVIATPNEFRALHFLGRADVVVSRSRLLEGRVHDEFTRDHRTGLPIISETGSLQRLMACTEQGALVIEARHFPAAYTVTPDMAVVLERTAVRLTPPDAEVHVFAWDRPVGTADCARVQTGPGTAFVLPPSITGGAGGAGQMAESGGGTDG